MVAETDNAAPQGVLLSPAEERQTTYPEDLSLSLKLWTVLWRAANAVQKRSEADIARHHLSPAEFAVLDALFHKGPLLLGEL